MKVLLCCYHEAGYRALRTLIAAGHDVAVATHSSPPEVPSVVALAEAMGLAVTTGDTGEALALARRFRPDTTFSVYYRDVLPRAILDIAPLGSYNFHPSLLPKHRGCWSAPWAIIDGDRETGVTCHRMIERVDAGEVIDRILFSIDRNETGISLYYKLVDCAVALVGRVMERAERGPPGGKAQEGTGSYHPREVPFGGSIDPTWPRDRIERFIRAMYFPPYPPATVMVGGVQREIRTMAEFDSLASADGHAEAAYQDAEVKETTARTIDPPMATNEVGHARTH